MTGKMLSGHDIICLAHEPWHGPWKTYQQVMCLLAERNRVLYIGPPVSLREAADGLRKGAGRPPVLEPITPTLSVYHEPRLLSKATGSRWFGRPFNWATSTLRQAHTRSLAQRAGIAAPILWVFDPMMAHATVAWRKKLLVYHVLDSYVEFFAPGAMAARRRMALNEAELLKAADIVFAVSPSLCDRCKEHNPNTFLVPNGVDYSSFQTATARATPADVRSIPRPIIGYVGAIQSILDFSLLECIAAERQEGSLVFVGPVELGDEQPRLEALLSRKNVFYLGCKKVEEVPAYMHACDVCIIPYHVDKLTVPDSDSIKVYEYLACGRPIVSTDVPSVRRFSPLVRIARNSAEFLTGISESLREDAQWSQLRRACASQHSWRQRVEVMSDVIRQRLEPDVAPREPQRIASASGRVIS